MAPPEQDVPLYKWRQVDDDDESASNPTKIWEVAGLDISLPVTDPSSEKLPPLDPTPPHEDAPESETQPWLTDSSADTELPPTDAIDPSSPA